MTQISIWNWICQLGVLWIRDSFANLTVNQNLNWRTLAILLENQTLTETPEEGMHNMPANCFFCGWSIMFIICMYLLINTNDASDRVKERWDWEWLKKKILVVQLERGLKDRVSATEWKLNLLTLIATLVEFNFNISWTEFFRWAYVYTENDRSQPQSGNASQIQRFRAQLNWIEAWSKAWNATSTEVVIEAVMK